MGGWTASIIALGKRLGDGNSLRETERERQIQEAEKGNQGPFGSGLCGALIGQSQPYSHSGPEYHLPPPMPSPNQGPGPSVSFVPKPLSLQGHHSWAAHAPGPWGPWSQL